MSKLNGYLKLVLMLSLSLWSQSKASAEPKGQLLKVGGDYEVTAIDHLNDSEFRVEFKAVTPTGKFDILNLHSNHVHVAQMVIFIANPQGPIPVWLLSNRAGHQDLRATKYLDMHSPLTDYIVM